MNHSHLQIGAEVLCDVRTVALTENCDLLLDVLDLVLGLLQVDGLDGDDALTSVIDTFEHLQEDEEGKRSDKSRDETTSQSERAKR